MQDYAGVFGDVCMDGTFLDVGDSFRQCEVTVGNLLQPCNWNTLR